MGTYTKKEIFEQSAAWAKVLKLERRLPDIEGPLVFFGAGVALGASDCLVWASREILRRPAYAISSQDLFLNREIIPSLQAGLFVSISRTGDVTDNILAAKAIKSAAGDATILTVIGEDGKELGAFCDEAIELQVFEESVATTKTISSMILGSQVLMYNSVPLDFGLTLGKLPGLLETVMPRYEQVVSELAGEEFDQIVVLGTGPLYGIAQIGALAMLEMSVEQVFPYQTLVYLHGPRVNVGRHRTLVIAFVSSRGKNEEMKALNELEANGATVVALGDGLGAENGILTIDLESGLADVDRAVLYLPFTQLLGAERSLARGYDPDSPPNLPKVF